MSAQVFRFINSCSQAENVTEAGVNGQKHRYSIPWIKEYGQDKIILWNLWQQNSDAGRQAEALEWHRQQSYRDWGSSLGKSPLSHSPPVPWLSQVAPPERADFPYSDIIVNANTWELAWRLIPEKHVWRWQHMINLTSKWSQRQEEMIALRESAKNQLDQAVVCFRGSG